MLRFPAVAGQFYMASPDELRRQVSIVMMRSDLSTCRQLGSAIAAEVRESPEPVLLIASTDMSHYEPDEIARQKDEMAIKNILALDPPGLHAAVRQNRISMCGCDPTVTVLFAALEKGSLPGRSGPLHDFG
ncbi:MAG: AmmeMemoRadiSam system protein B [Nitrospiria bacterium]